MCEEERLGEGARWAVGSGWAGKIPLDPPFSKGEVSAGGKLSEFRFVKGGSCRTYCVGVSCTVKLFEVWLVW